VLVLDWVEPLFVAGNWVPDLVRAAGGEPALSVSGHPSRRISLDELEACRPDLIVVAPCGLDLETARRQAEELGRSLRIGRLSRASGPREADAAETVVRIIAFDGRVWFSRPGPRLVEGAEALAAWLAGAAPSGDVTSIEITEAKC
jgi:iron complex transport system substrate-binding protein